MKVTFAYVTRPPSKAILDVLKSGQFSPGPKVREFEETFAALHGAKHAIFVNSGTDALRLSLLALKEKYGWKDGDMVAVPAVTFVASVNVILQAGLKPFFVDVGMNDYLINPWNLERRIADGRRERLRAILPVHLFGHQCNMDEIGKLAKSFDLKILEDSCETILNGLKGDASCYSTYMAHHITTGVGGFAITNDDELNLLIRSYANHGRDSLYLPGYCKPVLSRELLEKRFKFWRSGYSCRGTEFEAAMGLEQLKNLGKATEKRRDIAAGLLIELQDFHNKMVLPRPSAPHTYMMFPIVLREESEIDKYDLCMHLELNGIETRDMMPIMTQPVFAKYFKDESGFTIAKWIDKCGFYIPCHPGMREDDIGRIKKAFLSYFRRIRMKPLAMAA